MSLDQKRMTLRYFLSIFFGTLGILFLKLYFQSYFDSVAAVALFSCIIAVVGEDQSLGPVLSKSLFRLIGVFIGGLLGYLFLYLPIVLFPNSKVECLLLIPAFFCGGIQWITKGGIPSLTKLIGKKKATHLLIQLQVAFGIVYVGSWDALNRGLLVAACRTFAIMYGCIALLLASLISYPQTSLNVSNIEIAICLRSVGKLFVAICHDRINCTEMNPYDHRGKVFSTLKSPDEHMKLIDTIDSKVTRGISTHSCSSCSNFFSSSLFKFYISFVLVHSLQPFLYLEPSWVPGLPSQLIGKEKYLSQNWCLFIGVILSRITRLKGTLTTLDAHIRLTRDMKYKEFNQAVSLEITNLSKLVEESFNLMASYMESPFLTSSGWKGDIKMKDKIFNEVNLLKLQIEKLSMTITNNINEITTRTNDNSSSYIDINEEDMKRYHSLFNEHLQQPLSTSPIHNSTRTQYSNLKNIYMREKIGSTLDYFYCLYPSRTFCNLTIQFTLHTISLIYEFHDFIQSIEFMDCKNDDYKYINLQEQEIELNEENHDDHNNNNNHSQNQNLESTYSVELGKTSY